MLSHSNIVCNAMDVLLFIGFDKTTNWLHAAPMFHLADGSQTFAVTMVGGGHSFIPRFEPVAFLAAVQDDAVTNSLMVPTMINMLANKPNCRNTTCHHCELCSSAARPCRRR